jgi:hypothetical protein
MVNDLMEMLAIVLLPFSIMAAAVTLVILIILILIVAFLRVIPGSEG